MRVEDIVAKYDAKNSTVQSIVDLFVKSDRIFCLHTKASKALILKTREQSLQSQAAYKVWKAQRHEGPKRSNHRWVDQKESSQQ